MSLRELAEQDLGYIIEGDASGFRWPITVTNPAGLSSVDMFGLSDDIAQIIDPDTGQAVSGRLASVAIRISTLMSQGLGMPVGIADAGSKPWIVAFDDINGVGYTFKVSQANPDRALGAVTCLLEAYSDI